MAAVIFVAGCSGGGEKSPAAHSGKIAASEGLNHDIGNVDIMAGTVLHSFALGNGGVDDLGLQGIYTSCPCTKARIELPDGSLSRQFGRSFPEDWSRVIRPGETFKVIVEFDPLAHGANEEGPFVRDIFLITSAPPDGEVSTTSTIVKKGTVTRMRMEGTAVSKEEFEKTGGGKG